MKNTFVNSDGYTWTYLGDELKWYNRDTDTHSITAPCYTEEDHLAAACCIKEYTLDRIKKSAILQDHQAYIYSPTDHGYVFVDVDNMNYAVELISRNKQLHERGYSIITEDAVRKMFAQLPTP
jgi:hypothetical protein